MAQWMDQPTGRLMSELCPALRRGQCTMARRHFIICSTAAGIGLLSPIGVMAALPPGVEGRSVRIQLDSGTLQVIPGDERADVRVEEDRSVAAKTLVEHSPPGRAIPIIYIVVGVLSLPVIWDTVREMLRREYYGGVIIDARQAPASITHDKTLPAGIVLFIGPDGNSQKYEAPNIPEDLLLKLIKTP